MLHPSGRVLIMGGGQFSGVLDRRPLRLLFLGRGVEGPFPSCVASDARRNTQAVFPKCPRALQREAPEGSAGDLLGLLLSAFSRVSVKVSSAAER